MAEKRDASADHLTFSQRYGYEHLPQPMRLEHISEDLRREIWNHMRGFLCAFRDQISLAGYTFRDEEITGFIESVLGILLKLPHDEIKTDHDNAMSQFKGIIEHAKFNKVLDLIEIVANSDNPTGVTVTGNTVVQNQYSAKFLASRNEFILAISDEFNRHAASYWLDISQSPRQFFPRSSKEQGNATQRAIETIRASDMEGATTHLRQAAAHINAQEYGDSIADSIHAVESVACVIAQKENGSLGQALDSLEEAKLLEHRALKDAFKKLYGYASDKRGIRHALLDQDSPDVGLDEAVFMFGSCASFAAYLVNKHRQMNQQQASGK